MQGHWKGIHFFIFNLKTSILLLVLYQKIQNRKCFVLKEITIWYNNIQNALDELEKYYLRIVGRVLWVKISFKIFSEIFLNALHISVVNTYRFLWWIKLSGLFPVVAESWGSIWVCCTMLNFSGVSIVDFEKLNTAWEWITFLPVLLEFPFLSANWDITQIGGRDSRRCYMYNTRTSLQKVLCKKSVS